MQPKCIQCGRRKSVRPAGNDLFKCTKCGALFDNEPEEGAPTVYDDPVKSAIANEQRSNKRKGSNERYG